ncbi:MAG: peptidyl-prolyl cis-trans isomerase [Chromatiaceae bacterium]|nr:peptidyl-prolyl cis-trans isomerase [Gammaproteobacteria bacterium]MCP5301087.1 peptidyl-prolyl cis-trans isomerase [Chromatiaceae bacterium]MCP5421441.1 peptidyl-prolyl cis-trans isomerase [Chromatiaceae bacterium]
MKASALLSTCLLALALAFPAFASDPVRVRMATTKGDIVVELDSEKAPVTVANFLAYVDEGFYSGTVFHRVIEDFMIQGGGLTPDMRKKETHPAIENEARNGLKNRRGTIAMARTNAPHSATAQFFINHVDNDNLDYPSFDGWGYAVFGKVVEGMDVVDAIAAVPTGMRGGHRDVPKDDVVIESVSRVQ